jgi:hypothetical protein
MPFNGAGVFQRVRNWVADATAGIKIRADYHDAEDNGFAEGLTNCITKDGQTIVTQNIPWNSKRITALADPVNPQDAATKAHADTKLPLVGGELTGPLSIKAAHANLNLNSTDAAGGMTIHGLRNNIVRWLLRLGNGEAESGANAGSNFDLHHYDDAGGYLGQVLNFNRATGLGVVKGDPTTALGIATKQYAENYANSRTPVVLNFTPVQQSGGSGMLDNKVYIGWNGGGALLAQVDATPLGQIAMTSMIPPATGGTVTNGRLAYAGDVNVATGPQNTQYEPYTGAVHTGWSWTMFAGVPLMSGCRMRYMQLHTTSWYTVGYA